MTDWEISEQDWAEGRLTPDEQRILIVDDDIRIRTLLRFLFEDEGYAVDEAVDGHEALDALASNPPDAMILDLMMPRVDGHGVLRARGERGLAPETRVLVLTAKSDASDAAWCWRLGADDFQNKPVEPERLLRDLQHLLRMSPEEVVERRREGLAEAERLDEMEAAFEPKRRRR